MMYVTTTYSWSTLSSLAFVNTLTFGRRRKQISLRLPLGSAHYTSLAFGGRCREAGVPPSIGPIEDA